LTCKDSENASHVANLSAKGANIKWYDAATGGNEYLTFDALADGVTYYAAQSSGSNESALRTAVTVILKNNIEPGAPMIPSP